MRSATVCTMLACALLVSMCGGAFGTNLPWSSSFDAAALHAFADSQAAPVRIPIYERIAQEVLHNGTRWSRILQNTTVVHSQLPVGPTTPVNSKAVNTPPNRRMAYGKIRSKSRKPAKKPVDPQIAAAIEEEKRKAAARLASREDTDDLARAARDTRKKLIMRDSDIIMVTYPKSTFVRLCTRPPPASNLSRVAPINVIVIYMLLAS